MNPITILQSISFNIPPSLSTLQVTRDCFSITHDHPAVLCCKTHVAENVTCRLKILVTITFIAFESLTMNINMHPMNEAFE